MALSAAMVFEIQASGTHVDDANGGGFKSGATGRDYTQGTYLEHFDYDDIETDGATLNKMVSVDRPFVANDVGNLIHVISGTHATAGWYEITAVTSGVATVDRNWASEDTDAHKDVVAILGGALATPGGFAAIFTAHGVAGWVGYIGAGTYTLSNTTANTSGGPISNPSYSKKLRISGYYATRNDCTADHTLAVPIISAGEQNVAIVLYIRGAVNDVVVLENIAVDCNSQSNAKGFGGFTLGEIIAYNCRVSNVASGKIGFSAIQAVKCSSTSCATGFETCDCFDCVDYGSTTGFNKSSCVDCIADGSTTGFSVVNTNRLLSNCSAYGCGTGFHASIGGVCVNCYAGGSSGYGYSSIRTLINCASYNNASGRSTGVVEDYGAIAITDGQPLTAPATDDFEPNVTALRGALIQAAGIGAPGQTHGRGVGAVQRRYPTLPAVANVWNTADDYGYAGALQSCSAGGMHASDIANCEAGNVKKDVVIDDVTGTYEGAGGGGGGPLVGICESGFVR